MSASPTASNRSSRVLSFPNGAFYIQSGIAGLVLDIESGFLKDPLKAGARVELAHRKSTKSSTDSFPALEQQLWRAEENYIVNVRTGHVLDIQGGVVRSGSRVIQNVRKTGKDAAGQHWLNDDGVFTLASNPKFVITIDGDATRDGTRITIQEKKAYNEKQKWYYPGGGDSRPASPSPSRAESISIRPDNFPTSWFYIKSAASGLVVDIEHGYFTDPMKAGARAEMNHQKIDQGDGRHSLLELQLWRYEAGYLINRRTGFVLDIQGGTLKLNARLIQWQRKAGQEARNQHWFYENGFIANVYNSRLVLDIDGDGSKDGAKIAVGERKATANSDQQWLLEEVRFTWLSVPAAPAAVEEIIERGIPAPAQAPPVTTVLPTNGWFYIKSKSSGLVVDVEQSLLSNPMDPNVLVNMSTQISDDSDSDHSKIESQLWRYDAGQIINRRSGLVLDCKQGVVRYGARLMQGVPKQGKEAHHQRWESVEGVLIIQGKPTFAIDIEGDGTKAGSRLSLQRPKSQNNSDQQWVFQPATFEWLQYERNVTRTITEKTTVSSKVVPITKGDWFFIKSSATGLVMDLEAGWITSPTDAGAYIAMKKQRSLEDTDKSLLERQLWRFEDGYFFNRRTGYVIDIYGRSAVVGVKLIQQHKATTEEDGQHSQLWNVVDGNIQLLHNPKLIINVESNKDSSRVQLVESKSTVNTWTLELAQTTWLKHSRAVSRSASYDEGLEVAEVSAHVEFPLDRWFYIKSKASNHVLDIEHGFLKDHTKPGAYLQLNHQKLQASAQKHALLELQLWRFENGYIINRRTGLVLDAAEGSLKSGTRLIQWTRKTQDNANQQWAVSNGFIHLKSMPNFVLDVDGDGTRERARISLGERKDKKNLDQRWTFESVQFTWLALERSYSTIENDVELLKEYEINHLARVVDHSHAPVNCWFYLKSGISDLVLEVEHGRQINHLQAGTQVKLAHQKLKSGKHSHALLELQLWRFDDGYIINRRSGLVLAVDKIEANAKLIQATKSTSETQRWVIEQGILRLADRKEFVLFLSYGRQGSNAFIRQVRQGEILQNWSFSEVHFSWLTLDRPVIEQTEEQLDVLNESDVTYLKKEQVRITRLERFSKTSYFFIRASNGYVVDIDNGFGINHMRVGAHAAVHPQTTAASASQHALLDIQLWTLKDGYLINKRTGLALTIQGEAKENVRLIQALPKDSIKWSIEGGYIFPEQHSHLALNIRDGQVILVERTVAVSWSVYQVSFSWLVWTEVILLETEQSEDFEFYEEFEEIVLRSSATSTEVIEYAKTEQRIVAPSNAWFYLVAGNKVASISTTYLLERGAEGASIELSVQKRFASAQRHALVDLQLWKLEGSYVINRYTGLYLTAGVNGSLILSAKQADATLQQWTFSEEGSLSLVSNSSQVVDFINEKAVLVERSASKTVWLYDVTQFSWITTLDVNTTTDIQSIEREITEYRTVYTRYIQYLTKYTITTTTTTTITRRIIRVHRQIPLEDATVVEKEGTVWACHLVEAGTGVDYVMQLVQDNTKNVYYIYIQWGSTEGQLEGPYESTEVATAEFQELFASKVGFEWSERETKIATDESWNSVEFEYDTITVEAERGGVVGEQTGGTTTTTTRTTTSTPKPMVDAVCPIANQVSVFKDDELYTTTLTQRSTGVIYITQLLYNYETKTYYVYLRWGENQYTLDGPYETVDIAKQHYKKQYNETFGITWEERKVTTNSQWSIVHHTFETLEEYEDVLSEEEQEHDLIDTVTVISKDTETSHQTSEHEHVEVIRTIDTTVEDLANRDTTTTTQTRHTTVTLDQPTVPKGSSWFRKIAAGAGVVAAGALTQVDGVWKRGVKVQTTQKAHVDTVAPIAKTSYVYYDDEVYDAVLVDKSTGVTHVTQLLYDTTTTKYYVYYRWGETDYKLDGPHETVESAKAAFQVTYQENFGVQWEERETTVSDRYTYEFKTYETFETIEEIEEVVEEDVAIAIVSRDQGVVTEGKVITEGTTSTTVIKDDVVVEHVHTAVIVDNKTEDEAVKEVVITKVTGVATQPAVPKGSSWFRKIATGAGAVVTGAGTVAAGAASGAGNAASGALEKVDGVWRRTVQVLTTRKANVDTVAPIAKTSYVYYDDEVYDAVLVDKSTGVTHVTQLLYDTTTTKYYVYYRWGETDYKLDGPHETVESAKAAFQVTYQENFGVQWEKRETTVSERYTYEVKTYETFETVEEIEEIIEEDQVAVILAREKEVQVDDKTIKTEVTTTTTTNAQDEIVLEHVQKDVIITQTETDEKDVKETIITKETGVVAKPAAPQGTSWFRKIATGAGAAVVGAGAVAVGAGALAVGAAKDAASGAGHAAHGALEKVDGVWKRSVQVLTTRKANVDTVAPIAKTSYVYYDDEVYDAVLVDKSTGVTHVTQLLYDTTTTKYYVYYRWGETDYKLDGPHETVESAKTAFQVTYQENFGVQWEERETAVSERFTYEVKTYETFETIEEVEEIVEETEAVAIIAREQEIVTEDEVITTETTTTTTTTTEGETVLEHVQKDVIVDKKVEVDVDVSVEVEKKEAKETIITKETGVVAKPAAPQGTSWFRKIATGAGAAVVGAGAVAVGAGALAVGAAKDAASGAGHAAHGALEKVDGVWKRSVQVLTTRKANVDTVAPIAKTSYVYYDDEVYDAVLVDKSTGVTHVTQLLYDTTTTKYYVYYRWGETDYKLDGPHETVESAKTAFQVTYQENFGVQWEERETAVSERFTYEVKTYETFETIEEVEEIVEETEAVAIIAREQEIVTEDEVITTETTTTTTTTTEGETVLEHVQKDVIVDKKVEVDVDVSVEVEKKEAKEIIITKETGVVAKPAAPQGTSWFRKIATATGAAVVGAGAVAVGAGALAVGAAKDAASGAGHAAHGALEKVDGVWKRSVQVLTTRKANVDTVAPIAKTSYVYYDDEVYDAVLVDKSTGVTHVTQLLYDTTTTKYYVYYRWGETDYKLDGPHETVESAKTAFQVTYQENFGVQWEERETAVSERFTYEVKTYETFETIEEVEEIVEETEAVAIIAREQEIVTEDEVITTETTTTTTTTTEGETVLEHVQKDVIVDKKVEVDVDVSVEVEKKEAKETIITKETGVVAKPAAPQGTSWFRKIATGAGAAVVGAGAVAVGAGALAVGAAKDAASGAGHAAHGALEKVDGVWKRSVQVLTTRKANVDTVAPIAKTSYVYYDDEVYDAVLVDKSTGVTHVTQLLYDTTTTKYYVYYRWGETDYKLDGPHETVESAKAAFQVTYQENFGVQWEERETAVSERFTYEVKTYETFETIEEVEEIVEETEAVAIIAREQEIVTEDEVITTETTTTTTTTTEGETVLEHVQKDVIVDKKVEVDVDVSVEVEKKEAKETIITKETGVVTKPAAPQGTSWFRKIATATGAAVVGAGAVAVGAGALAVGAAKDAASGAGHAAHGALEKVDGVWKRSVQVLTTRKAHVDTVAPIAKTSYVYYDDEVYDAVLVDKSTGVTHVTQLLYDTTTTKYYVYYRWGETDYKLDGPHETVESAKAAFQVTYQENFGVQWEERETAVSERFTYEVKTYETFETIEEVEEIVEETEAVAIIAREQEIVTEDEVITTETTTTTTTTTEGETVLEHVQKDVIVDKKVEVDVDVSVEVEKKEAKETIITKETGVVAKPAAPQGTSWFRKIATGAGAAVVGAGAVAVGAGALAVGAAKDAASGAGHAAHGALEKVDGVWKRSVQVLTTRKANVDTVAPIAKTSYVYYDDEVYDAVLVDKSTGVTHVTQLLYDTTTTKYYVYYRWGETDYKLDGPHETVESAKTAFQVTYQENFGVQWEERETAVSERFTYEVKTYETFETIEEVEEIVEETEAVAIIAREQEIVTEDEVITTETTTTTTTTTEGETVLEHVQKDVIVDKKVEVDVDVSVEVEKKEAKETIITKETGVVAKPAAPQGTSWFRKIATATGAAVVGAGAVAVGAGALAVGAAKDAASGAGHAAHGALEKVDGVWKRSVQVLTTRKANVDTVAPIAKTSYVYYDDEVYDAVLVDKSTGVTHVTQLLYDTTTTKYYVYYRWGETDYKLDGPHETVESAKAAFQVTYQENFGVQWEERETAVSERFTYEVKTYETFETIEEVEEIVEETEAVAIIAREQEIVTEDEVITTETTTTTTTTTEGETVLEHVQKDVIVDKKVEVDVDVSVEVEKKEAKETIITKETGVVAKPAAPQGTSWFRKIATATGAAVVGAGAVAVGAGALAVGAAKDAASGAGHAAHGALEKVDGVWKRSVQVLTTRKANVDTVAPIAKTSYVYYDDEVYDAVLVDKSTGVTHVTQLLYDTTTTKYYVYYRWGETDYKLDGPHETVESAKTAFQVTYQENFGVQWEERETAVSERFTYEVKTYETFETIEEVEEIVEETEAVAIIAREQEIVTEDEVITTETTTTTTTTTEGETVLEHVQKDVIVDKKVEVDVDVSVEVEKKEAKETIITKETGVVTKPAAPQGTSWFRKIATATGAAVVGAGAVAVGAGALAVGAAKDAASGAGHAAHGALEKVDGVWKRSVQVLTTRKAHVDTVAPIAKTSYVYYDDEVYDAVLVDKSTGVTHVTQLLYDTTTTKYYVYYRWGETDYKLDGPHETVESAKAAFQVTYQENFGVQWEERETAVSERFTYEVKTYETFETIEEVEEIVEETEAVAIIAREQEIVTEDEVITTETTTTTTTTTEGETVLEHVQKDVIIDKKVEVDVDVSVEVEKKEAKEIIITKETGVVAKPAAPQGTSWFRKIATATGAAVVGAGAVAVGAGALAVGAAKDAASGAGHAAHGALEKVDGVWKRSVQVLTTRKANVDTVAPIAKTSYVYYDDEVYDAVLVDKSTGVTHVTQLLYDTTTTKYYVYYRWGETDYKLDGPHETVESAKTAFQVTYQENFGVQWEERETAVSERFTYEVKTYETFETIEEVEEIVEETEAVAIIARKQEIVTEDEVITTETTTTTTTTTEGETVLEHVQKDVIVDKKVEVDVDVSVEVEKKEAKEIIITKETGVVAKPAAPQGTSWFRKIATATGAAVVGAGAVAVGAGALAVGAAKDAASGAGHAAHGALEKVDGVWKRSVQVLTTRKANVDTVAPIAKTSYVYYDDEVYDAVLVDKSTGVTHVTQLLYDTTTTKYYVYYRWGETDYKLDGPHETVESAKTAFQVTYQENFGVQWEERETAVSERFTYEVKTYETFETIEEVEEIVEETEAVAIIAREQEIVTEDEVITTETTTTTTTTTEGETVLEHVQKDVIVDKKVEVDVDVSVEVEKKEAKETIITKETGVVAKPAAPQGTSWFRKIATATGAAVVGAGAVAVGAGALAVGAAKDAASGAGHAAHGALEKVDGVWKRSVQVLTTRKAHVDTVAPIAKTSYVYYDDEVYDAVLVDKSTGVTHVTQLLYDTTTTKYYVYYRWGETDYKLDGPHETVESAKTAFQVTYQENFGVQWEERETAVSERFTYEVKTYETFETIEEVEEIVEETEAVAIIAREQEIVTEDEVITTETTTTTTTTTEGETVLEHVQKDVIVDKKVEVDVDVSVEVEKKEAKEIIITKETGVVAKPAAPQGTSWFRKIATATGAAVVGAGAVAVGAGALAVGAAKDAASGAGHAAHGALEKVDGVWKRSVQVLTTRKANVDTVAPIAKTSYVYYDDEVYDAVLVDKSTGVTHVTQLLYDTTTTKYYVYYRWGETDYKLDGPHETVESAKAAFQVTYQENFGVQWEERETAVSERFTYEVKTYETFETIEEVEEIVEETEAVAIIAREQEIVTEDEVITTETTTTTTTTTEGETVLEHVQKDVIVDKKVEVDVDVSVEVEKKEAKETIITKETGVVAKPAAPQGTSWFRKIATATGAAVVGAGAVAVGAGALAVGAAKDAASGAGHAAHGALEKVDGVWKRSVQVLTTRKANVDTVAPIAKTSYVYYDDEVYDAVLVDKSTGVTHVTQLLYDTTTTKYYVYYRWGETDYKLDGPHETVESAKTAFQVTYQENFGVQWEERETAVSERFTYEVKTYETFETIEEVEEIVEETEAVAIIAREQEIVTEDEVITTETTTTTTTTTEGETVLEHVQKDVIVDKKVEVDVDVSVEVEKKEAKEIIITKETGVVAKPAAPQGTSWFRKIATATGAAVVGAGAVAVGAGALVVGAGALTVGAVHDVASGAGHAAHGALEKVDGVWKRSVQVLTTRKANVDTVAPIAKTSYVYYDDEVYDAVLVDKSTGVTHVTQLLYDTTTTKYYVYYRWGETDYKLDGPHETVESAKAAFQVTYQENFGVQWEERETAVSERFTYEVKTYETFETIEEVEEIVEETEAVAIIAREQEIVTEDEVITTETTTTTTTTTEGETVLEHVQKDVIVDKKVEVDVDVSVEVEKKEAKETIITKETGVVAKPAAPQGTSWFRKIATATGAAVVGAGAVAVGAGALAVGAAKDAASGAGHAAHGALEKVDGVWKRSVQVLTTRKANVDTVAPIAKTSYVYYDDEVYDAVLVDKSTGVTHVTQLLYDTTTTKYYVYYRWGETDYKLDGPHETVESAKAAFQVTYQENFGVQWEERETAVSERFTYEVKTYETFETIEEVEEIVEETEAVAIIAREQEIVTEDEVITTETTTTTTTTTEGETVLEHVQKDVIVDKKVEVDVDVSVEVEKKEAKETIITKETGVVTKPAAPQGTSWFRKIATATGAAVVGAGAVAVGAGALAVGVAKDAASGAGHAAHGALEKVDGVWKRSVQVLTTRKANVDTVAPIAKTSYVYYDDEVYDAVLVDKSTGVTHVTQLLYDTTTTKYYVYYRWGETDYKLDGPHETVESAKTAFQVTYQENFGVQWEERETAVSERFTYEVKTYETFETIEEVEEIVEETEAVAIIAREQETITEEKTVTEVVTSTVQDEIVVEQLQEKTVVVEDEIQSKETVISTLVDETITVEATVEDVVESVAVTEEQEVAKEIVITKETGVIVEPTVTKETSWFRKVVSNAGAAAGAVALGAGAVAVGAGALVVGAGALTVGAVHDVASGAGHAAHGALEKVDGVWKRTVQVLTTRKAHVDAVAPIAKTSYVYYDDEVYDAVLVEKSTGVTYVTQLLFDSATSKYYVYVRWGETDYKLDGPHETVESAKTAFQVTYHDQFGVKWQERETTVSERFTYEVKTYETFETVEVVEEVVDEKVAEVILKREQEVIVDEETVQTETTTSTTTTRTEESVSEVAYEVEVIDGEEITKVITTTKETGVVAQPVVTKGTSWFRRLASGAGLAAAGALIQVDGVWKRTVQVLTTRKAHVDAVAPIAKTSYVYYDDEVYDAVLVEKSTGVTYVTQLLYDTTTTKYYVYVRWGETDYKLDGPHDTVESAKAAFQISYREQFGVQWEHRETTVSERFTYEVKTYETFETTEEIEEIVEDYEVSEVIAQEKVLIEGERVVSTHQSIESSHDDTVVRNVSEQVLIKKGAEVDAAELSRTQYETLTRVDSTTSAAAGSGDLFGGAAAALGGAAAVGAIHHGGASTTVVEETKKAVFDLSSLPLLPDQGINVETGAPVGVIDLTSGTAEAYRELPRHLRPRAWVSLHVGGWQDAPHELEGFMRLDDQSGQRLMESARDAAQGKAQEATPIDNLRLPEIVALFAKKLYGHFDEELPAELTLDRLRQLGPHRP